MSISSCYDDITKFNTIKSNLENVVSNLNEATNRLSPVANNIYAIYNVDESQTPISSRSDGLKNDIVNTVSYIKGTIIPAINNAIVNRKNTIAKLEEEQRRREEEREREEQERREAEEKARSKSNKSKKAKNK